MPTRRVFLLGSLALAGGVAVGYREYRLPRRLPGSIDLEPGQVGLTPYVVVDGDGITIIAPRAEMGQGIHTTLAALVAEELDVPLSDVRVEHGPPSELYSNQEGFGPPPHPGRVHGYPTQFTGGQTSIKDAYVKMRKAGAAARDVLVRAAAEKWQVDPATLSTNAGDVVDADGRRLGYVELAPRAATLRVPDDPPLKPTTEWTILGRSQPRVDMAGKCTGTAQYAPRSSPAFDRRPSASTRPTWVAASAAASRATSSRRRSRPRWHSRARRSASPGRARRTCRTTPTGRWRQPAFAPESPRVGRSRSTSICAHRRSPSPPPYGGTALDPHNVEAQVESALLFGLTAAVKGEITLSGGAVEQLNFDSYEMLRIYDTPPLEIEIVESGEGVHGVGESATPGAAPALGNAIFAATGRRLRELPFRKYVDFA